MFKSGFGPTGLSSHTKPNNTNSSTLTEFEGRSMTITGWSAKL